MPNPYRPLWLLAVLLLAAACGKKEGQAQATAPKATVISVTQAAGADLEITENTVGSLESLIDPGMGAEVAGKVLKVLAHAGQDVRKGQLLAILDPTDYDLQQREAAAEIARIEALLANQARLVQRNARLVQQHFISQTALDDITTQQAALREQLEAAKARLAAIAHNNSKTRVYSPIDGRVEKQIVSPGDFVKQGDSLFQLIGTTRLRAHLPFPESVTAKFKPGQTVRLSTPTMPDRVFTTTIKEIKPLIGSNRAADVIADVVNQAGWQGGASVTASVVLGVQKNAVVVPEAAVVLRPAGEVVYTIAGHLARQQVVKTGLRQQGLVQIREGLLPGATVAVDGAAYLTDGAEVKVQPLPAPR